LGNFELRKEGLELLDWRIYRKAGLRRENTELLKEYIQKIIQCSEFNFP
jgi:hypothetical protein